MKTANCLFCGQEVILENSQEKNNVKIKKRLEALQLNYESYEATRKCGCKESIEFANKEGRIMNIQEEVEDMFEERADLLDAICNMTGLVAEGKVDKFTFDYDDKRVRVSWNDKGIKIEKKTTRSEKKFL